MTSLIYFPAATTSGAHLLLTRHQVLTWCGKHSILYSEHYDQHEYVVMLTKKKDLTMFMLDWRGQEFYIHTPKIWPKNFSVC